MTQKSKHNAGMTLLEIMIVLAVMAMVIGIAAPRVINYFSRAKATTAEIQLKQIKGALDLMYIDIGRYPVEAEGLATLVDNPTQILDWRGPYLSEAAALSDPWGRPYIYMFPTESGGFTLQSLGEDGQPGGEGAASDIIVSR